MKAIPKKQKGGTAANKTKTPVYYKQTYKQTGKGAFDPNVKVYTKTQIKQVGDKTIKNETSKKFKGTTPLVGDGKKITTVVTKNNGKVTTKKAGYKTEGHSGLAPLSFETRKTVNTKAVKKTAKNK